MVGESAGSIAVAERGLSAVAFAMADDRQRLLRAGFDAYLEKPIDVRAFPGQVRALLQSTRAQASR